jgi:aspartate oxidase
MKIRGDDHVYLDVTHKDPDETRKHFPTIYEKCLSYGIDITKDYIPVAPAAHYLCEEFVSTWMENRVSVGCMLMVNVPVQVCMVLTVWLRIR